MKIGIFTAAFPQAVPCAGGAVGLGSRISSARNRLLACGRGEGPKIRRRRSHRREVVDIMRRRRKSMECSLRKGLAISSLGYYPNPLHPDKEVREHSIEHLKRVIAAAGTLGVGVVGTFVGRTWNPETSGREWQKDIDLNFELFKKIWPDLVKFAADKGVKIAIEHCPMIWADTWPGGSNLPYSPALIRTNVRNASGQELRAELRPLPPRVAPHRLHQVHLRVQGADIPCSRQGHGYRSRHAVRGWDRQLRFPLAKTPVFREWDSWTGKGS